MIPTVTTLLTCQVIDGIVTSEMLELTDNALIALGLREHAQTCDEVASKYQHDSDNRQGWKRRADRCRDLAARYEAAARAEKPRNFA